MPMTRHQGITNRSKAKSQNARNCGPTTGFPAKSNTLSRQLLPISQADLHSSQTTWKFLADQSGATAIEYAIIAGGLSIVIVVAVNGLGTTLNGTFASVNSSLK